MRAISSWSGEIVDELQIDLLTDHEARHTDGRASKYHIENPVFKEMTRKFDEEDSWAQPMEVIVTKPVAGFRSRC